MCSRVSPNKVTKWNWSDDSATYNMLIQLIFSSNMKTEDQFQDLYDLDKMEIYYDL